MSEVRTTDQFGPLQPGFALSLPAGYTALVGRNNAGKSAILQLVFRPAMDANLADQICLIMADRPYVASGMDVGGGNLEQYNRVLLSGLTPLHSYDSYRDPFRGDLAKLLLAHGEHYQQKQQLDALMERLGFHRLTNIAGQSLLDSIGVRFQGSGFRQVFPILAALTDDRIDILLIDEPEAGLEPVLQRVLRDILVEYASRKQILVATHSHLLIDPNNVSMVRVVERPKSDVAVRPLGGQDELADLVFGLLGNSTEDLLLPGFFVVVEGATDQTILEAARRAMSIPPGRIKVVAAGGMARATRVSEGIRATLTPLVTAASPYRDRVACLIDEPTAQDGPFRKELDDALGERLFVLPAPSIEEFLPEALFERAGRIKADDLATILRIKPDKAALLTFKAELSISLAEVLALDDVEGTVVAEALRMAAERAAPTEP